MKLWPSDFLLWGSSVAPRPGRSTGRPPVPGAVSLITRVGGTRPGILLRFRWPCLEEWGWEVGDKVSLALSSFDDGGVMVWCGSLQRDEKGHTLFRTGRDARVIFPLQMDAPYFPRSVPLLSPELLADGGEEHVLFGLCEGDDVLTVGQFLGRASPDSPPPPVPG